MTSLESTQCSVCGYRAAGHSLLVRHLRSHTGERPFACSLCPRTFTVRHNLLRHERIHTGERPYKCCVCEEDFVRKAHLQNHMRIHQGRAQRSTEQQKNVNLPVLESLLWDDPSQN